MQNSTFFKVKTNFNEIYAPLAHAWLNEHATGGWWVSIIVRMYEPIDCGLHLHIFPTSVTVPVIIVDALDSKLRGTTGGRNKWRMAPEKFEDGFIMLLTSD